MTTALRDPHALPPVTTDRWPLVGRDRERAAAAAALDRGGVLLAGPAGVGRSRLARDVRSGRGRWVAATASARGVPFGALAGLLDALGVPPDLAPAAVPGRVAAALPAGTLLAVDDVHLLDGPSAAVLHHLALHGRARLLLTARTGRPVPDAVTALWKDGPLDRVDLAPLGPGQVGALAEAVLGGPADSRAVARLHAQAGGSTLLLCRLLHDELAAGRWRPVAGVWQWPGDPVPSAALAELVLDAVGPPAAPSLAVAEVLAVGGPLDLDVLGGLTGPDAVEEAERSGVVRVRPRDGRAQAALAVPLLGAVLRDRMPATRARRLRARRCAAGEPVAPDLAAALARDDLPTARRLAGGDAPVAVRGYLLARCGDPHRADALLAAHPGDGAAAALRAYLLPGVAGRAGAAEAALAALRAAAPRGPDAAAAGPRAFAWSALAGLLAAGGAGEPVDPTLGVRAQDAAVRAPDTAWLVPALAAAEVRGLLLAGERAHARQRAADLAETGPDVGAHRAAAGEVLLARVALDAGEPAAARRRLAEATALLAANGRAPWPELAVECAAALAEAASLLGERAAARDALAALAAAGTAAAPYLRAEAVLAQAWVEAGEGSVRQAAALARRAALVARGSGQHAVEALALHAAARFGDAAGSARLADLAGRLAGPRARAAAAHAAALARADGPALAAAATALLDAGDPLAAADAAAQAAVAHRRAGDPAAALAEAARARRLAAGCDGAATPAVRAARLPLPLTAREREVVTLLGTGLSNREIAARFVVSVRTVEGHVYRACTKLGVPDRAALAAVL